MIFLVKENIDFLLNLGLRGDWRSDLMVILTSRKSLTIIQEWLQFKYCCFQGHPSSSPLLLRMLPLGNCALPSRKLFFPKMFLWKVVLSWTSKGRLQNMGLHANREGGNSNQFADSKVLIYFRVLFHSQFTEAVTHNCSWNRCF